MNNIAIKPGTILFLCTGNSCRSPMAEGIARELGWKAVSGGINPSESVSRFAVQAMADINIDISEHIPRSAADYHSDSFDLVVTLGDAAKKYRPEFSGSVGEFLHHPIFDPYEVQGSSEKKQSAYNTARDALQEWLLTMTADRADISCLNESDYRHIVFFTGAGMSAESGIPTYRGSGGIWKEYRWEDFACQSAFENDPEKVLEFHHIRRDSIRSCQPNRGHRIIADIGRSHPRVTVITQNIDGLHQKAGFGNVIELHGSLWRVRCDDCGITLDDPDGSLLTESCRCGRRYRPDIVWFGDCLNETVLNSAAASVQDCDLFVSVGTSGVVWPAAGFPGLAAASGARCIEINLEPTDLSHLFHQTFLGRAGFLLPLLFGRSFRDSRRSDG